MGGTTKFRSMDFHLSESGKMECGGGGGRSNGSQKWRITFEGQRGLKGASDETSVLTELLLISHPPALSSNTKHPPFRTRSLSRVLIKQH